MPYLDAAPAPSPAGRLARVRRILASEQARGVGPSGACEAARPPGASVSGACARPGGAERTPEVGLRDESLEASGERVLADIEALERAKARLDSRLLQAYAALHAIEEQQLGRLATRAPVPVHAERVVAAEIACATGVGSTEVSRRLELALAGRRHRVLHQRLRAGQMSLYRALRVVAETRALPDEILPALEATVLAPAPDGSVASQRLFTTRLRRCVTSADHRGSEERRCAATRARTAFGRLTEDGMGFFTVTASAERVVGVLDRVEALARAARAAGDERTLDQLRSDLLTDLALFGTIATLPTATGTRNADVSLRADHADHVGGPTDTARGPQPTCGLWLGNAPPAVVRIVVPFEVAAGTSEAACAPPGRDTPPDPDPAQRASPNRRHRRRDSSDRPTPHRGAEVRPQPASRLRA